MNRGVLVCAALVSALSMQAVAGWFLDGTRSCGLAEADPVFVATGALQADLVAASNKADTAYGWGDHGTNGYVASESDPLFAAYSNSAAFVADVQAAQTNDGYEADTTYVDDLASFTNAVRAAQTNDGYEADTTYVDDLASFTNAVRAAQTNDGYEADTDTTYADDLAAFTNAVRSAQTNDGYEADTTYVDDLAAFTNAVRAAQTNDGYEADTDTTYLDDLASFTNAVRAAQTNVVETDPIFAATGALQVDLVAASNKADTAYGWGNHSTNGYLTTNSTPTMAPGSEWTFALASVTNNATAGMDIVNYQTMAAALAAGSNYTDTAMSQLLPVNIEGAVLVDPDGDSLHFEVQYSVDPLFASVVHGATSQVDQTGWTFWSGYQFGPLPVGGVISNHQDASYGCVEYTWTNAVPTQHLYYVRFRSTDLVDYSDWRGRRLTK